MLSRRQKGITGNRKQINHANKLIIKPSKSRQIIRRYHHLLNKRDLLLSLLNLKGIKGSEHKIEVELRKLDRCNGSKGSNGNGSLMNAFHKGKAIEKNKEYEDKLLIIHSLKNDEEWGPEQMVEMIGYVMNQMVVDGGLEIYQAASRNGQDNGRGGDTSRVLKHWMIEIAAEVKEKEKETVQDPYKVLEIGALSSRNEVSRSKLFSPVIRIDLKSEDSDIIQQDFMKRRIPNKEDEYFDIISCSLVINFVSNAKERGLMCRRILKFLKPHGFVFLVLPLACVEKSRYFNQSILVEMFQTLGLREIKSKCTAGLYYALFQRSDDVCDKRVHKFSKRSVIKEGNKLNNFSIIL